MGTLYFPLYSLLLTGDLCSDSQLSLQLVDCPGHAPIWALWKIVLAQQNVAQHLVKNHKYVPPRPRVASRGLKAFCFSNPNNPSFLQQRRRRRRRLVYFLNKCLFLIDMHFCQIRRKKRNQGPSTPSTTFVERLSARGVLEGNTLAVCPCICLCDKSPACTPSAAASSCQSHN